MAATWLAVLCFCFAVTHFAQNAHAAVKEVKVTTVLTSPFAQYKSLTSLPDQLDGYIIDLLDIMKNDSITFKVTSVKDGKFGSQIPGTRNWNGMIRELIDNKAQLAAAPLTNNSDRALKVDFINPPFMTFDLAILMRKCDKTSKIKKMLDLSKQNEVKFGVIAGGTTQKFFDRETEDPEYRSMSNIMAGNTDDYLLPSVEDGVRRVRESTDDHPFAFIGEQFMLEYHASREPCELVAVKGDVSEYNGEYHLATSKTWTDSDTKDKLKKSLAHLKATGQLEKLYKRWWIDRAQCSCSTLVTSATAILIPLVVVVLSRVSGE